MVTISDIAKRAGVSIAAVSLALNGKPGVGPDLRERILVVAEDLGYRRLRRPSRVVAMLHISRMDRVLDDYRKSFMADYIDGVQFEAGRNGLSVDIRFVQGMEPLGLDAAVLSSRAEGLIIMGTELERDDLLVFSRFALPKVFVDAYYPDLVLDFVDIDNTRAMFDIVRFLWDRGHRDLGIVTSDRPTPNYRLRENAFSEALFERGVRRGAFKRFVVAPGFEGARIGMRGILARKTGLPSALVCVNDLIALGTMKALREAGLAVPGRLSVVGFDNIGPAAVADPPLTTYEVSKREIGRRALKLLLERIEDREFRHSEKVMIAGELIERESVGVFDPETGL